MNENQIALAMETDRTMLRLAEDYEKEKAALEALDNTSEEYTQIATKHLRDKELLQKTVEGVDILQSSAVHTVTPNNEVQVTMLTSSAQQYAELMYNLTGGFNGKVMETLTEIDKTPFEIKFPNDLTTQESYEQNVNAVLATPEISAEIQTLMANGKEPTIADALTAKETLEGICRENGLPEHALPEMIVAKVAIKADKELEFVKTNEAERDEPVSVVEYNDGVANIGKNGEAITAKDIADLNAKGYNESRADIDNPVARATTNDPAKVTGNTHLEAANEEGTEEQAVAEMNDAINTVEQAANRVKQISEGVEPEYDKETANKAVDKTLKAVEDATKKMQDKAQEKTQEAEDKGEAAVVGAATAIMTGNIAAGVAAGATVKAVKSSERGSER